MNRRSIYLGFYRTVKYEISLTEINMTLYFNIYSNMIKKRLYTNAWKRNKSGDAYLLIILLFLFLF